MSQKRANVDVALRTAIRDILGKVDYGDQPVTIPPDVEDRVSMNLIRILERRHHLGPVPPADGLDDLRP